MRALQVEPEALITTPDAPHDALRASLSRRLSAQRAAFEAEPYPSAAVRRDRLRRAVDGLVRNERRIVEAARADFGHRATETTLLGDLVVPVRSLRHALRNLDAWMKPERRSVEFPLGLIGARACVFYQPLGVVGVVSPWNSPFCLAYTPLAGALAAGNRAMLKPSEFTPATSALIAEVVAESFAPDEVDVVQGGVEVAARFSALPFDHLVFTGGARVARSVLRAAAEHLTPVTLELGGKAPVLVARGADIEGAAAKVVGLKLTNAGQVCMGPDHVLVHRDDRARFVEAAVRRVRALYPDYAEHPDITCVPLAHRRARLAALVRDAVDRGLEVIVTDGTPVEAARARFPVVVVVEPTDDAAVMREEIFGPILPVVSYDTLEDAVRRIRRGGARPLALYHLGGTPEARDYVLKHTHAGGVTFDDVMLHPLMQDLPFGGVGESGMGRYMGRAGFRALSNEKAVAQGPWLDVSRLAHPPYGPALARVLRWALRR